MTSIDLDNELNDLAEQELAKDAAHNPHALATPSTALRTRASTLPTTDDKNLAVVTHVATAAAAMMSGGLLHLIVPAVAMIAFKDKDEFVRQHARNQLNFQLTYVAAMLAAVVFTVCTLGFGIVLALPAMALFWILDMVTSVRAALAASRGEHYEFPWSLKLFA